MSIFVWILELKLFKRNGTERCDIFGNEISKINKILTQSNSVNDGTSSNVIDAKKSNTSIINDGSSNDDWLSVGLYSMQIYFRRNNCMCVCGCAVDRKIKSWLVLWHWVQSMFAHEHWNVHIARSESYTKCSASYADLHVKIEFQYLPLKCCVKLNRINTKRTTHPSKNDYPPTYHHHHHHHHFFSSNLAKCEWSIFEYFPNGACTFTDHAQREWRAK